MNWLFSRGMVWQVMILCSLLNPILPVPFTVNYVVRDNGPEIYGQVLLIVKEVQDAPVIKVDEEFLDNNPQISSRPFSQIDQNLTFYHNEGQRVIAEFDISDELDRLEFGNTSLMSRIITRISMLYPRGPILISLYGT